MKKVLLLSFTFFLAILFSGSPCFAQQYKLGFVDVQKAVMESLAGKAALEKFQKEVQRMEGEIIKEKEEIEKLGEVLEKQSMMLTDSVRREREKDYLRRQRDFERRVEDSRTELQIMEAELTNKLLEKLVPIIQQYGKDNKFSMIFERREGSMLFGDSALDMTDTIIDLFNQKHKN